MSNKKYTVQLQCEICKNPIIVSYTKFKPFKNSPATDIKLEITVGCPHIATGPVKPYIDFGVDLKQMYEDRRIDYQELEDKEHQKRLKEILGDYDEDEQYNPSRF